MKLLALFAVALLTTAAAPAKPKLRGTMDVAVARKIRTIVRSP